MNEIPLGEDFIKKLNHRFLYKSEKLCYIENRKQGVDPERTSAMIRIQKTRKNEYSERYLYSYYVLYSPLARPYKTEPNCS